MISPPTKMERRICFSFMLLVSLSTTTAKDQTRWSRQISSYTSDISDWVPLTGPIHRSDFQEAPIKRQAIPQVAQPRILSEPFPGFTRPTGFSQDSFPSRAFYQNPSNRQLYLQSVPSAPQNFLTEQGFGQNIRFGLTQPNFPLSQGFVAPNYSFENLPQKPQGNTQTVKFDSYAPKPTLSVSPQAKPFGSTVSSLKAPKLEIPKFVDGYRAENFTNTFSFPSSIVKKPQSLQKLKLDTSEKAPKTEFSLAPQSGLPPKSKSEREEVQLLYVPVESLNRGQFNFKNPLHSAQPIIGSELFGSGIPNSNTFKQTYSTDFHRGLQGPLDEYAFKPDFLAGFEAPDQVPKFSSISSPFPTIITTTAKPKKLKPHQPPLAVFLVQEAKKGDKIKVSDVLISLKNARTIAVLDSVSPENSPKVFIGPSSLSPPENYVKFDLPYLSNIEQIDKKLRQLPFFVAPLSYHTPDGFAKIPFPSPHVGSVIVNSQIKDNPTLSTPIADVYPNSYTVTPPTHSGLKHSAPQKPTFSYYSTVSPKNNSPSSEASHYSFEPQTVTPIRAQNNQGVRTGTPKNPSYFLGSNANDFKTGQFVSFPQGNIGNEYTYVTENNSKKPTISDISSTPKAIATNAPPTTTRVSSSSRTPSTYPSALLETHNPYSINQAFHFSTPLDRQNYFEENKASALPSDPSSTTGNPSVSEEIVTEKQTYQSLPNNYGQNYSPEIQYGSESPNVQTYDSTNVGSKPEVSTYNRPEEHYETPSPAIYKTSDKYNDVSTIGLVADIQSTRSPNYYNQYVSNSGDYKDANIETTTSSTTTTTTTRRTPLRPRGRPHRYTTQKPESQEANTRAAVTRRPLKERRPLPSRSRYEPNKITTERSTRKHVENSESTTRPISTRSRTRGRVQYKPKDNEDENYESKRQSGKEHDLAYQRDILHQNYPVTLMERMSTVDIEAITEPTVKITKTHERQQTSELYDTENAYSAERATVSDHPEQYNIQESDIPAITTRTPEIQTTSSPYVPRLPSSTKNDEFVYLSRSSGSHIDAISYSDADDKQPQYIPSRSTTPIPKTERSSTSVSQTEATEKAIPRYSLSNEYSASDEEYHTTTRPEYEITKINSLQSASNYEYEGSEQNTEQSIPQTTLPHRIRRPGALKTQQTASTEAATTQATIKKIEIKRRPSQPVTYRPAYDRRRTTMRIEEIEADLKTKPVNSRTEVIQERRHPVYRPEPTTEPSVTTPSSYATTRHSQFRRRRPPTSYSTTTTETSAERKKPTYEVRNRFRGRRPAEKSTEKTEVQTETTPTTTRQTPLRYNQRLRLPERINRRPSSASQSVDEEEIEPEDQDSNYSINRPKYVAPDEDEKWSPKFSTDTFKPYNPNDIVEDKKIATTERRSNEDSDLDIITARNDEYEDILISVTPASNRLNKKIPEIPPTLEALVEQSKSTDEGNRSTFESMLEEVMKSLEEQDEDEYTNKVMKHKGGEIGEIPPETIVQSGENTTTFSDEAITTESAIESSSNEEGEHKEKRRGFWKKVKVRPVTTESFEVAESQFYSNTVNRLGDSIKPSRDIQRNYYEKLRPTVTTYKPRISLKDFVHPVLEEEEEVTHKFSEPIEQKTTIDFTNPSERTVTQPKEEMTTYKSTTLNVSPGDVDLGTGTPDPTVMDIFYSSPTTEMINDSGSSISERSDAFSLMDYFFSATSPDDIEETKANTQVIERDNEVASPTEPTIPTITPTESDYISEEITESDNLFDKALEKLFKSNFGIKVNNTENTTIVEDIKESVDVEINNTKHSDKVTTSTESSFLNPMNVVSTSMSTEISHETEICFRGKCIKTNRDSL